MAVSNFVPQDPEFLATITCHGCLSVIRMGVVMPEHYRGCVCYCPLCMTQLSNYEVTYDEVKYENDA